jgi:hypothetical protein
MKLIAGALVSQSNNPVTWSVRGVFAGYLMQLEQDPANSVALRSAALEVLRQFRGQIAIIAGGEALVADIVRHLAREAGTTFVRPRSSTVPPGSPIGWGIDCVGG